MQQDILVTGQFYHLFNRANSQTDKFFYPACEQSKDTIPPRDVIFYNQE